MKYKKLLSLLLILSIFNAGCSAGTAGKSDTAEKVDTVEDDNYYTSSVLALNWQQESGEFDAVCYQAYNTATKNLEEMMAKQYDKPVAVILDIDETVLDNSVYAGDNVKEKRLYTNDNYNEWIDSSSDTLVAGADKFLSRAKELGVEIFYVTNRVPENMNATIENLSKLGLPNCDEAHILVKTDSGNKKARWDAIGENYEVVMYCGDNLNDFNELFYKKSNEERKALVEEMKEQFGSKYIIIPNAICGDWESALYNYDYSKSDKDVYNDRYDLINKDSEEK